jgi:hypothetical protein
MDVTGLSGRIARGLYESSGSDEANFVEIIALRPDIAARACGPGEERKSKGGCGTVARAVRLVKNGARHPARRPKGSPSWLGVAGTASVPASTSSTDPGSGLA